MAPPDRRDVANRMTGWFRRGRNLMSTIHAPNHLLRLLGIFVLPLALFAALLPAPVQAGLTQDAPRIPSEFQVYTCPTDYAGTDYLTDCTPGGAGDYSITVTDTEAGNPTATTPTDADGFILFGTVPGPATFALDVPGDFASFYYACFDDAGIFQFDGTGNVIETELAAGDARSCRWYVIAEDASGASPSASASASPSAPIEGTATVDIQVFDCPVAYSGDEYLTDCAPIVDPVDVLLSPTVPFDENDFERAPTGDEGRAAFVDLPASDYSVAVDIPGEFANFYVACFDVTSGSEVFLFDGDTNTVSFDLSDGSGISCRFYVIPEDLSGQSVAPTVPPRSSTSPGAINVLPSTGTGSGTGGSSMSLLLAGLAIIAAAAVAVAARRMTSAGR